VQMRKVISPLCDNRRQGIEFRFSLLAKAIPLVRSGSGHSLGAGTFNHAAATSGVKVAQHPEGLTLTLAQDGGAR